jgi:hypothetical protein
MNTLIMPYDWNAVQNTPQPAPNLAEAIQRLLAAKTAANRSPKYVKALRGMLAQFLGFTSDVPLAQIGLMCWTHGSKRGPNSRQIPEQPN